MQATVNHSIGNRVDVGDFGLTLGVGTRGLPLLADGWVEQPLALSQCFGSHALEVRREVRERRASRNLGVDSWADLPQAGRFCHEAKAKSQNILYRESIRDTLNL